MTQFVPTARISAPAVATGDVDVAAPPELPRPANAPLLSRLVPVVMAVAMIGVTAVLYRSGSVTSRNPVTLIFPAMMLVSVCATAASGRARQGSGLDADRRDYLDYLSGLRRSVTDTAAAQRSSLLWRHPDPVALWALVGGDRMWERRDTDPDFGVARVGLGTQPLATRLVAPRIGPADRCDPVTATAVRRFIDTHSSIPNVPIALPLPALAAVTVDGQPAAVRGLLRAVLCQLAVWHAPDRLLIAGVIGDGCHEEWDWLKWLPHHQHPTATDAVGSVRMRYPSLACAEDALVGLRGDASLPHLVVVVDGVLGDREPMPACGGSSGLTILRVGTSTGQLVLRVGDEDRVLTRPDRLDVADALVCARRLAAYRAGGTGAAGLPSWPDLLGVGDPAAFDPIAVWGNRSRRDLLRVPIGTTATGAAVDLDIKEAAASGMGPHGLCIGATGSGKSELLRTVALGMIARHSPDELNLVLVDFKGGATFLELEPAHHVAAVITNLADEAPLVARMADALAGEMTRRQERLRTAGNFDSVAAYQDARRAGAPLPALPALFIIVDEFSELLSQHPDFIDMFAAIGRLGRSLGMHLLLASQRLDEGRLRGLESHLSYRICLKTLSGGESRMVLGVPDAHELPTTPGAGYLRSATGELIRFQTALVSGPCPRTSPVAAAPGTESPTVLLFTAAPSGAVNSPAPAGEQSVLQAVLDRVAGQGPPAHPVWLPPLGAAPALGAVLGECGAAAPVLTVPIGVVDRPFEQRRTPLVLDLSGAAGNVAVVGAPQAGKSTALCTLIAALAASHDPGQVQFYCLDFGGGLLESVRPLPHVGAVAGRAEPDLVSRVIAELESTIARREARFRARGITSMAQYRRLRSRDEDPFGDVFLMVDGWGSLRHDFDTLEASITELAARGLSFGVHVVLSAARWADIRPALRDQIGSRIELRLGDPADSEADRRRAQQVPADAPGRGLTADGLHMVIAAPRLDGLGAVLRRRYGTCSAPPVRLLPALLDRNTVVEAAGDQPRSAILLGLEERKLGPVAIDFDRQPNLLVFGDTGCGKTSVLRTVCQEIVRTTSAEQAQLIVVDYRRALLGVVASEHLGGYAISAATLSALLPDLLALLRRRMPGPELTPQQLRSRSWWSGPQIYLVVDDYDLVAAAAGNPLTPIAEFLPYAGDLGLHLVVARRTGGAARAMFEPLLAGLRDLGCTGLMLSGNPDDGPLIGSVRPVPLPPGRGTLVTRHAGEQRIQVVWSPPP